MYIREPSIVGNDVQTAGGRGAEIVTGGGAEIRIGVPVGRKVLMLVSPPASSCEPSSVLSAMKPVILARPLSSNCVALVLTTNVNELPLGAMRDDTASKSNVTDDPSLL